MDTTLRRNTIGGMVVPGPLAWAPPAAPRKRRAVLVGVPLLLVSALLWQAAFFTLPYLALAPGSAGAIGSMLKVPPEHAHPPRGQILITTVSLKQTTVYDALQGWVDPDTDVLPEEAVIGDVDPAQYSRDARRDMVSSKQTAVVLAFRRLGYPVDEQGEGTLIDAIAAPDVPVAGVLAPGDTIVSIDGRPTPRSQDTAAILQTKRPGDTIRATVEPACSDGAAQPCEVGVAGVETITLGSRQGDTCTRAVVPGTTACMGVVLATRGQKFDLPFDVTIDTQGIGGPSAGLAFTLALLDELTPGELTGGKKIAVTGTIDIDGTVGDVGGVRQKTAAVLAAGADVFLVPPGEFKGASARGGKKLKVIAVANLDEALAALGRIGGDLAALDAKPPRQR